MGRTIKRLGHVKNYHNDVFLIDIKSDQIEKSKLA